MDYGLINIVSILLGLISWLIPGIVLSKKCSTKKSAVSIFVSMILCVIPLFLQILYLSDLIAIENCIMMIDTYSVPVAGGIVLITVTILLNCIVLKNIIKKQ